jgi:hypothetical protein
MQKPVDTTTPYGKAVHIAASRMALSVKPYDNEKDVELIVAFSEASYVKVKNDVHDLASWMVRRWIDAGDHDVAEDGPHWLCPRYTKGLDADIVKYDLD